eukprot:maker-scaffold197_size267318-snap-gene-1.35 protein:Tk09461 transcript:maker-scaffold197_size267318-snap-gene-1.35-mRNA-1 annotation:"hypothetical protein"
MQFALFFFCTFLFMGVDALFGGAATAAGAAAGGAAGTATTGLASIGLGAGGILANNGILTIPLLAATAGTLATPLAVLGLIKLGAAALIAGGFVALGSLRGRNNDDEEVYHESSSGYHRRRRSADIAAPNPDALFALISSMDTHGCGKQLVCELEAKDARQLQGDESLILSLFGDKQKKGLNVASAKAEYELAAQLGQITKSQVMCRQRYTTCPYTGTEMMKALRESNI